MALQSALCVSAWSFYRTYRALGLYPPEPRKGKVNPEVSAFEFVCVPWRQWPFSPISEPRRRQKTWRC